ncbi:antibiotic biosynthesis monooxygenase family protein [Nonomuraea sp. NPDC059007]|uniref:antibiotic biosynthesis monooxygenase family protein n=1 Tax=Nonomuraea sp. NPDC059007 TaxID=3346692 RepID=UPI0036A4B2D5
MSGRVRVMVHVRLPDDDPDAVSRVYHRISGELAGTEGLLSNELLRSTQDPRRCAVLSEWESLHAFRSWEQGAQHRDTTAPLRPYQDDAHGPSFAIYAVEAAYRSEVHQP